MLNKIIRKYRNIWVNILSIKIKNTNTEYNFISMSEKKIITITPNHFKINNTTGSSGGNKTKKQGRRKTKQTNNDTDTSGGSNRVKTKKSMNKKSANAKQIKKDLIRRIKEHQKKRRAEKNKTSAPTSAESTPTLKISKQPISVDKSINELNSIIERNKEKEHRKKLQIQQQQAPTLQIEPMTPIPISTSVSNVATSTSNTVSNTAPKVEIKEDPPYGCLKMGGKKPTYSQYTMKNRNVITNRIDEEVATLINDPKSPNNMIHNHTIKTRPMSTMNVGGNIINIDSSSINDDNTQINNNLNGNNNGTGKDTDTVGDVKRSMLQMYKEEAQRENLNRKAEHMKSMIDNKKHIMFEQQKKHDYGKKIIKKKHFKRTFKVGRNKNNRSVSVLIRNRETRRQINKDMTSLFKVDIQDMKRYLKRHNLLKHGSSAPKNVIRQMYQSAISSGELENTTGDVLIHNFLNEK